MNAVLKDPVSEEVQVTIVPPIHIQIVWEQVEPLLHPAVERSNGRWTTDFVYQALMAGQKHLWVVFEESNGISCVAVTSVMTYPGKKMLSIDFLGGDGINKWSFKLLEVLNNFAKDAGCNGIEAYARLGFWKWLEPDGFEQNCTVFEKRF